jgi:hypothetical protein
VRSPLIVPLLSLLLALAGPLGRAQDPAPPPFLEPPYLQLGSAPAPDALSLLWHAADLDAD